MTTVIKAEEIPALRWRSRGDDRSELRAADDTDEGRSVASVLRMRAGNQPRIGVYVRGTLRVCVSWERGGDYGAAWKHAKDLARALVLVELAGADR